MHTCPLRCDCGAYTYRLHDGEHAAASVRSWHCIPMGVAGLLGRPSDKIGAVSNLALSLSEELPLFFGEDCREFIYMA